MTKANDFRLGNWIVDYEAEPEKTIYWQIEGLHIYPSNTRGINVYFRKGSCMTFIEYVEPVKLTNEWLEKFGFKKGSDGYWDEYSKGNLKHLTSFDDGDYEYNPAAIEIKYVHQLQNLYYALCQEELILEEDVKS